MAEIYIPLSRLHAVADAVAALEPCAWSGKITRDQILIALGEHGDIWPASILSDLICEDALERERAFQTLPGTDANVHHVNFRTCNS